jgi:hypothetical protein
MTTEVAILNKQAIALAADSAVTINMSDGTKIYNSANKLFALSKFHPIGIMVYGAANLSGVPWESIIKFYRSKLGDNSFPILQDYCDDFLAFLEKNLNLFLETDKKNSIINIVYEKYELIRESIGNRVAEEFEKAEQQGNNKLPKSQIKKIVNEAIDYYHNASKQSPTLPSFSQTDIQQIEQQYGEIFTNLLPEVFEDLCITKNNQTKLVKIALNSLIKNDFSSSSSGIVIAGFGEEEIFPSLHTYKIECVIGNKIKYAKDEEKSHEIGSYPAIIPFAQGDMIYTFIQGIDPVLHNVLFNSLDQILKNFFETIMNMNQAKEVLNKKQSNSIDQISQQVNTIAHNLLDKFYKEMAKYQQDAHVNPILMTVNILPKDELGAMAEALVNLTSLKRRVTTDEESVGGPTDVALISKGDGFIWLKRKHYFRPELNADFFSKR